MVPAPSQLVHLVRGFVKRESVNVKNFDMPWSRRLWLYRHGFASSRGELYDISPDNVDAYLSDADWTKTRHVVKPYESGLMVKPLFHRLLSETHAHLLPDAYGIISDGTIAQPTGFDGDLADIDDLLALARRQPLVIKPVDGLMGKDVHVLGSDEGALTVDGAATRPTEARELLADVPESIIVEYVQQAGYASDIYPKTPNTIRLLTMVDPDDDEPFLAAAVHRFGTAQSEPVDNASAGGVFAGIDRETGTFKEVVTPAESGAVNRFTEHPDTGVAITGQTVPGWERITEQVLDLTAEFGWMWPCVGWDVIATDEDGSLSIIEGNERSAVDFHQTYEPLLADDRVRRFYEHHGVI